MDFNFKKFWKESTVAFILKNILLAGVIFIAIAYITLFAIDAYTHHGQSETVPDLYGKYVEEAEIILANQNLRLQVIDSLYDRKKPFGTIVEQTPPANSTLKKGRPVYLIINVKSIPKIPVPDVRDVSYRQAEAMLKAIELHVADVEYEPSEYRDLVLDIRLNGQSIVAGTRLPEGTGVTLVVGKGAGTESVFVPDLLGMNADQARSTLLSTALVSGGVDYDVEPTGNETEYAVYRQQPAAGSWTVSGSRVDIWLSTDKNKVISVPKSEHEEENFF